MSLVTVNVFSAGSDERRHGWEQDPRRFAYALNDPADLFQRGWKNQFEFQAYNSPVPGTIQLFLQEAGTFSLPSFFTIALCFSSLCP